MERTLTITVRPDGRAGLRAAMRAGVRAAEEGNGYLGEYLNFETPGVFFGRLTENRWEIVRALQGAGDLAVRELARRVGRDVKRVHEDTAVLMELGLIEKTERGGLICPYADIHVDMHLTEARAA